MRGVLSDGPLAMLFLDRLVPDSETRKRLTTVLEIHDIPNRKVEIPRMAN